MALHWPETMHLWYSIWIKYLDYNMFICKNNNWNKYTHGTMIGYVCTVPYFNSLAKKNTPYIFVYRLD